MRYEPRDSRRRPLEVGQIVAYNRSGDVIEGEIVGLTPTAARIHPHPDFQRGRDDTKISRVRNFTSILVLS